MKGLPPKLVWGAFAALTSACSLVTSLDGLTDGPASDASGAIADASAHDVSTLDGASTADGGTRVDDAGNPVGDPGDSGGSPGDADASDGATIKPVDGGGTIDASNPNDAATAPDTSTVAFCAGLSPKPLFCADYDEGSVSAGWSTVTGSGGTVSLSTTEAVSAPASMKVITGSVASNGTVDSAEYKPFPSLAAKAQTMTLAFDVRFNGVDSGTKDAVFAAIHLDSSNGASYEVQLDATPQSNGDLALDMPELGTPASGNETYVDHFIAKHIATQQWVHLVMTLTVPSGTGAGTATLSLDGAQVISTSINVVLVASPTPSLILGVTYVAPPSNPWGVHYDNVTFDSK